MTQAAESVLTSHVKSRPVFDVENIRRDFPLLQMEVHGKPLAFLDNAATSQKPQVVIDALTTYYTSQNANIHRGVYHLSEVATELYEKTRECVKGFINANSLKEIIFTRGTTEAINLVASSLGRSSIREGDEIIISTLEHHSNIVPWQHLCDATGAQLRVIPINDSGEIIFEEYLKLLSDRTKLVALVHVSNSLGTINPVREVVAAAHAKNALVLLDGAQAVPHMKVDMQQLDCDFFAFSSHKVFGPTGVGVLYGKEEILETMPPYQGGGDMIRTVTFDKTTYNDLPHRFEAGTPNIAGVIGFGKALEYVEQIGYESIHQYEQELLACATEAVSAIEGLKIVGTAQEKASVISFVMDDIHPHDVGTILDREGVAIRTGHHCTQPVMDRFNIPATSRASLAFYNTKRDVEQFVQALERVRELFA